MSKGLQFLHVTKTGGTSIESQGKTIGFKWGRFAPHLGPHHVPLIQRHPKIRYNYDWFMVCRNPYDRMLSEFYCRFGGLGPQATKNLRDKSRLNEVVFKRINKSREGFLDSNRNQFHYYPQHLYLDPHAKIHILRFESLADDFSSLMNKYNRTLELTLHLFKSEKIFSVNDFSREVLDLINDYYEKDFLTFGYDMK